MGKRLALALAHGVCEEIQAQLLVYTCAYNSANFPKLINEQYPISKHLLLLKFWVWWWWWWGGGGCGGCGGCGLVIHVSII